MADLLLEPPAAQMGWRCAVANRRAPRARGARRARVSLPRPARAPGGAPRAERPPLRRLRRGLREGLRVRRLVAGRALLHRGRRLRGGPRPAAGRPLRGPRRRSCATSSAPSTASTGASRAAPVALVAGPREDAGISLDPRQRDLPAARRARVPLRARGDRPLRGPSASGASRTATTPTRCARSSPTSPPTERRSGSPPRRPS